MNLKRDKKRKWEQGQRRILRSKWFVVCLCSVGVGCVAYGMTFEDDLVFVIGLIFVVAGYLIIRRRLKESLKER